MRNPYIEFQNCILIYFERTHGRTDGRTDGRAQSNMPLQLFQSLGHKNSCNGCRDRNQNQSPRGRAIVASSAGPGHHVSSHVLLNLLNKFFLLFIILFLKHIHFQHSSTCMYHKWNLMYTCITIYNCLNIAVQHKYMLSMYWYFTIVSATQYVQK